MANLPVDVRGLVQAGAKLLEQRDLPVRLSVVVELDAPDDLVEAVRAALTPRTAKAFVDVDVIEPGGAVKVDPSADAVIVLIGSGSADAVLLLKELRRRAIPAVAAALAVDPAALAQMTEHPIDDVACESSADELVRGQLADWIVRRIPNKHVAAAHNFEFLRRPVAWEAVKATAWQNAVIGGVTIIPGADMPLMTMNQGKMLLQIAAAYGQRLGADRIKELAAVVGGGLVLRVVARQVLAMVPVVGWAVKAGIGYTGTSAMGQAAIAYFEQGADLSTVLVGLRETAGRAVVSTRAKVRGSGARLGGGSRSALPASAPVSSSTSETGADS